MFPLDDTIAAIASPPGGAARGIVRVSGPNVGAVVGNHFRADDDSDVVLPSRPATITGEFRLPETASPLPCDLYLWPAGRSYTGDAVAELHTLGSTPLLEALLAALCSAGARMAEPGEFTLRAFLAGRLDLAQAEAVLGVIDAADPQELDVALSQLAGGLSGPLHELRDMLLDLLAPIEAGFDFADEDLPPFTTEELNRQLTEAAGRVATLAQRMASRGETAGRMRAVLVGPPNAGKSSLFNALARRTGALVSEQPGTTRDYLTAELDLDGVKCQLIDTAGVDGEADRSDTLYDGPPRPSSSNQPTAPTASEGHRTGLPAKPNERAPDTIQQAAEATASQQARRAHVRIVCVETTCASEDGPLKQLPGDVGGQRIVVLTKADLDENDDCSRRGLRTSSLTGEGVESLRAELRRAVLRAGASGCGAVAGTVARCRESLRLAADSLGRARDVFHGGYGEELAAAEIHVALGELGKVVGAVYTDDVLDRIFSRFCIGK